MLQQRSTLDTLIHRQQILISSVVHEVGCKGEGIEFVHTGAVLGNWYQFIDGVGLYWSRLDCTVHNPAGFATVDPEGTVPQNAWELEHLWEATCKESGIIPLDEG